MKRDTSWGNTFKGFGRILTSKSMLLTFGVVLAVYFLVGCAPTVRVEDWKIQYHEDASGVRAIANEVIAEQFVEYGFNPKAARGAASLQTFSAQGFADEKSRTLHVLLPRDEDDLYRFCVMGHEMFHATHGDFHGNRAAGCAGEEGYTP